MAPDEKMLADIVRAEPVERKAITQVMNLSVGGIDEILWVDDSGDKVARRKRDFRVRMGNLVIPFEVKADFGAEESGNIALEYKCRPEWAEDWMMSGIASTGSDVWAQMVRKPTGWAMYFAKVSDLRRNLMTEIVPGCWTPSRMMEGARYERLASNKKSGDVNKTWNMLLNIERHVEGMAYWYSSDKLGIGSVDWRYFARPLGSSVG